MKKAIIYGMSLALILSMTACGGSNENAADKSQETSTPEVSQSMESSTPTPEQTTQTAPETTPTPESVSTPTQQKEQLFTDCSETMYATTTVNVRSSYSTNSDKLGSLTKAQSVTRTGIGTGDAAGWSRIEFNGKVAYVSSDYLSATKPQVSVSKPSTGNSSSGSTQTSKPSSKPSTGGNSGSSGGQTSKPSTGGNTSSGGSSSGGSAPAGGGLAGLEDWANNSGVPSNEYQGGTKDENGNYSDPNLEA